jgi:hypothetical protein
VTAKRCLPSTRRSGTGIKTSPPSMKRSVQSPGERSVGNKLRRVAIELGLDAVYFGQRPARLRHARESSAESASPARHLQQAQGRGSHRSECRSLWGRKRRRASADRSPSRSASLTDTTSSPNVAMPFASAKRWAQDKAAQHAPNSSIPPSRNSAARRNLRVLQ